MKREFLVVVGGAAVLAAGLVGCGSDKGTEASSASSSVSSSASSSSEASTSAEAASDTVVTVDGQPQNITGAVNCNTIGGNLTITIGDAGAGGLTLILSEADPPVVHSVALGTFDGQALGYQEGTGQGSAEATKLANTYHVTGEAFSAQIDLSNPMDASVGTKPFDITATCP